MAFEIDNNQNIMSSRKIFGEKTVPKMTALFQKFGVKSERTAFKILIGICFICFGLAIFLTFISLDTFIEPETGRIITNETPDESTR